MVIGYEGFLFLDHVSEGIQLDPDRAILLLFALHSLSYFFEIINLHIQSNRGVGVLGVNGAVRSYADVSSCMFSLWLPQLSLESPRHGAALSG